MKIQTSNNTKRTYVAILLDDSSSMHGARQETISGFNEQLLSLKNMQGPDHEVFLSVIIFSDPNNIRLLRSQVPVSMVSPLELPEYTASGHSTALLDAMNYTISHMVAYNDKICQEGNAALVLFITDGQNNSSVVVRDKKFISTRITELQGTGHWTFTYMGIGSAEEISGDYGIAVGNVAKFAFGAEGAVQNFATNSVSLDSYSVMRSAGVTGSASFYTPPTKDSDKK